MQIVCKVKEGRVGDAKKIIAGGMREVLPERASEVRVEQVFPGLTEGRRARLFTVELPEGIPQAKIDEVVRALGRQEGLEYAVLPSEKRPQ